MSVIHKSCAIMPSVVFYFQVHQPYRLNLNFRRERFEKEISLANLEQTYFDEELNKTIMQRVAKKCYLPANDVWLATIDEYKKSKRPVKIALA